MNNDVKFEVVKFGQSEHKRSDLISFYISAAISFKEMEDKRLEIDQNKKVYDILRKNNVLKKDKKVEKISREISFFSYKEKDNNSFPLFKLNNKKIISTNLLKNILKYNENDSKKIFGKTYLEHSILFYLLKSGKNKARKNPLLYAIELAKSESNDYDTFIKNVLEMNIENIFDLYNNCIDDNQIKMFRKEFAKCGSGIPGVNEDREIKQLQELRDSIFFILFDNISNKQNYSKILDLVLKYNEYSKYKNKNINKAIKKFFGNDFFKKINDANIHKDVLLQEIKIILRKNDIRNFIEKIYLGNKIKDYSYLLSSYFSLLNFFVIENDVVKIDNINATLIDFIINNIEKIYLFDYINDDIFDFYENNLEKIPNNNEFEYSIKEIIKTYYNKQTFEEFFESIKNNYDQNKITENVIKYFSKKRNSHIKGLIDGPTIYEFVINILFFSIFYNNDLNSSDNNDSFLNYEFRKSINTLLTSNFIPQRFASGGRPDAIFNEFNLIVEPTLQLKGQIKHEVQSINNHLKVAKINTGLMIAPQIENDFFSMIYAFQEQFQHIIIPINSKILLDIIRSNDSHNELISFVDSFEKKKYGIEQIKNIYSIKID